MAGLSITVVGEGCTLKDVIAKSNPNVLMISPKLKTGESLIDRVYLEFPALKNSNNNTRKCSIWYH